MINKKVLNYIKETKEQGFSDQKIRKALLVAGWKEKQIDEGFKNFKNNMSNIGSVRNKPNKPNKWLIPVIVIIGILAYMVINK